MPQRKFTDGKYKVNVLFVGQPRPATYRGVTDVFVDELFLQFTDMNGGFEFFRLETIDSFYIMKISG